MSCALWGWLYATGLSSIAILVGNVQDEGELWGDRCWSVRQGARRVKWKISGGNEKRRLERNCGRNSREKEAWHGVAWQQKQWTQHQEAQLERQCTDSGGSGASQVHSRVLSWWGAMNGRVKGADDSFLYFFFLGNVCVLIWFQGRLNVLLTSCIWCLIQNFPEKYKKHYSTLVIFGS